MNFTSIDNGQSGKGLLFVISSVSGGGKTTVIGQLMGSMNDLRMSISHTTRKPRPGELEGHDYYFIDPGQFRKMVKEGLFLEWAQVYGQNYGTSDATIHSITSKGFDAILDIDVQGARQVKNKRADAVLIFIVPPGEEEQERRLKSRGTENNTDVNIRLEAARQELAFASEYDYCVFNEDIEAAVNAVSAIITAERCRNRNWLNKSERGGSESNEA